MTALNIANAFLAAIATIQVIWLYFISRELQTHKMILEFIATGETGQIVSVSATSLEVFVDRHQEDVTK